MQDQADQYAAATLDGRRVKLLAHRWVPMLPGGKVIEWTVRDGETIRQVLEHRLGQFERYNCLDPLHTASA